ncbi:hypothetical protein Tco_1108363 [Tanacetum coccineum]
MGRSIGIDIPVCLGLTLVKRIQFHLRHYGCHGFVTCMGIHFVGYIQTIPLLNVELALTSTTTREPSLETWLPKDHSVRTELELAPGPSRKRSRSPSSPSYPDATTFSDGEPAASESPELNPEDLTARLEDIKVEIDTLHADREDKEVLISELQDSLAASENEIAVLQLRVDDAEARQAEDHAQIQSMYLDSQNLITLGKRESDLPTSQAIPLLNVELALTSTTTREPSLETWLPKDHSVRTELELAPGPSRKRSRSPSSPSYPDATTFSDGEPAASESPELNPEDLTARLEDIEVEIDTLHADREDKEVLISELQDSLAASENEIAVLQLRVDDAEARQAEDHAQIQSILARLGL